MLSDGYLGRKKGQKCSEASLIWWKTKVDVWF
jgi:hypothetical protein